MAPIFKLGYSKIILRSGVGVILRPHRRRNEKDAQGERTTRSRRESSTSRRPTLRTVRLIRDSVKEDIATWTKRGYDPSSYDILNITDDVKDLRKAHVDLQRGKRLRQTKAQ